MTDDAIRVLVLDDDELHLELVERILVGDGFAVRRAETLAELENQAPAFDPHIVLIDMNIPGTPRERLVPAARAAAPSARVVICSAWEPSRLRALCKELGADDYVSKGDSVMSIGQRLTEMRACGILGRR